MRKTLGILCLLLVICLYTGFREPKFLGSENIENNVRRTALIGFMSIGAAVVIISGGIDLSIGAVIALTACLFQIFLTPAYERLPTRYPVVDVGRSDHAGTFLLTLKGAAHDLKQDDQISYTSGDGEFATENKLDVRSATVSGGPAPQTRVELRGFHPPPALKAGATVGVYEIRHMPVALAVGLVLLISLTIGVAHGLLVTKMRLQPFVVTLCGMMVYRGLARYFANDKSLGFTYRLEDVKYLVGGEPLSIPVPLLGWFSSDGSTLPLGVQWVGVPVVAMMLAVAVALGILFLNYSVYGRYLMALGRNEQAARYSGIRTDWMVLLAYVICSLLAGFTGILFILEYNTVQPTSSAMAYELTAIAAAVLGGCSLRGGEGAVVGVIVGAAVMQVLNNVILLLKYPPQLEWVIIGMVILVGVVADELVKRVTARRRSRQVVVERAPPGGNTTGKPHSEPKRE